MWSLLAPKKTEKCQRKKSKTQGFKKAALKQMGGVTAATSIIYTVNGNKMEMWAHNETLFHWEMAVCTSVIIKAVKEYDLCHVTDVNNQAGGKQVLQEVFDKPLTDLNESTYWQQIQTLNMLIV